MPLSPSSIYWYLVAWKVTVGLGCTGHASQTVVLHLRAQGLGDGDEQPSMFSYWSMVNFTLPNSLKCFDSVGWFWSVKASTTNNPLKALEGL